MADSKFSWTAVSARRPRWGTTHTAHVLLVAVTLVWGTTFPLVKAALRDIDPLWFNTLRMTLAAALLLLVNWRQVRVLDRQGWAGCALAGLLLALGYELQTAGLARTSSSRAAFLTGLVVVFVPLMSPIPGVRAANAPLPQLSAYLGAATAFAGIVLLTTQPGAGWALLSGLHTGEWLVLGCALVFALHLLTLGRIAAQVPARALGSLQIAVAALFMWALAPVGGRPVMRWTPIMIAALLVTAVFATAAAFTIQSWAQQRLPATHTALIFTLEPVFAWLTSLLLLHERLGTRALAGAALILCGIVLSELGPTALKGAAILPMEP